MKLELCSAWLKKLASQNFVAILCMAFLLPGGFYPLEAQQQTTTAASTETAVKIPAEQLDALVAPIALYPDPMLAQVLAASTYPLEIVQLYQWLEKHKDLKDKALADAVMKEDWDPSIQAMAGLPEVVKRLAEDIQWTTDLGNAFLAQQSDVMDSVQRMRKKAEEKGNLKSGEQVKVETKVVETKEVIVIEQSNPQVVYVPSYNPTVVYGPPVYPYPPIYYPPPGYYAAGAAISFGVGVAMGAAWGGGWGWGCGWGGNDIDVDINNSFNRNANINRNTNVNRSTNRSGTSSGKWQHNSQHRGGAPYSDRATANKYGGQSRGDSLSSRQQGARQNVSRQGGNMQSANRSGQRSSSQGNRSMGSSSRSSGMSSGNRSSYSGSRGSSNVGSRNMSQSRSSGNSAMGSGSRSSYSGSRARSSSSRGSSSMGSRGGGGRGGRR